jgi:hypothetical protein
MAALGNGQLCYATMTERKLSHGLVYWCSLRQGAVVYAAVATASIALSQGGRHDERMLHWSRLQVVQNEDSASVSERVGVYRIFNKF